MMQDTAKSATRILIVDDHPVVLSGCRSLFASDTSVKIDEAADAKSGHKAYASRKPDVTVIDINLPDVSGFELMRRIRKDDPDAKIIMFSMNDDPAFVVRAVEMGAQGYVSKSDDPRMLVKAVRKVAAGDNFISPQLAEAVTFSGAAIKANPASLMSARELEILRLLGRGDKIVEVADALGISYKTVANTTSLLKQKLGAKNHSDLIRIAVEMGLADLSPAAFSSEADTGSRVENASKQESGASVLIHSEPIMLWCEQVCRVAPRPRPTTIRHRDA